MAMPQNSNEFVVREPLILLFVGNVLGDDLSQVYPMDVYAAVHGWWRLYPSERRRGNV